MISKVLGIEKIEDMELKDLPNGTYKGVWTGCSVEFTDDNMAMEYYPVRQGIYRGDGTLLGESGAVYKIKKVKGIVEDISDRALTFVNEWRKKNLKK